MTVSARKAAEMAQRRAHVARLYLIEKKAQAVIAQALEVSQSTVSRDLTELQKQWIESALVDINEAKGKELARIDALELAYWDAWTRSLQPTTKSTQKAVEGGIGQSRKEASKTTEETVGDPRWLAGVQWCISERCKILGLYAPKAVAGQEDDGALLIRLDV